MAKRTTSPLKITATLTDGRLNSADGIVMLDAVLYHAWFLKHAPHVLEGLGTGIRQYERGYHFGLPLRQLEGGRYAASRAVYEQDAVAVEHWNKRPDFFKADKLDRLDMEKGLISDSVGTYRAYRMPNLIRTVRDGKLTFYAMGHAQDVEELLSMIPAVGKKPAMGWGIVDTWKVEETDVDYSLHHPEHGLMRPTPVDEWEPAGTYPVLMYGIRPPYWKPCNKRLCYVPVQQAAQTDA